jgi:hypothetical protein
MSKLTRAEQNVLAALDNEAIEMTREERAEFRHQVQAWKNAAVYADQYGMTVEHFRRVLTKLTGVSEADTKGEQ